MFDLLCDILRVHLPQCSLKACSPVGGGSINDAYQLDCGDSHYFIKLNSADRFPSMFDAEARGLAELSLPGKIRVPKVIATGEQSEHTYILMEFIESGNRTDGFWDEFGSGLSELHRTTADQFGADQDNYIGSLVQYNGWCDSWIPFFIEKRLEPNIKLAKDNGRLSDADRLRFERLSHRLDGLIPEEPPALIHGDLWSGNFLCDGHAMPVLIDPAVYYGHREMDIAMSYLFGGFNKRFYRSYNKKNALHPGWEERIDLHNLYPLLVHVVLFGGGYSSQVSSILKRFT